MSEPKLIVDRYFSDDRGTLGKLYLDDEFLCYTLEDRYRDLGKDGKGKVPGTTRIPAGTYPLDIRGDDEASGFSDRYLKKFGAAFHHGMIWVREVPFFEYILIHCGNTPEHTEGCLLVGKVADPKSMAVWDSVSVYKKIYPRILDLMLDGTLSEIEYRDNDR